MAEETGISWTDSTFNPWWGCTKVGPECKHCYAEALDRRTGGTYWGIGSTPRMMSANNWRKPRVWNRDHEAFAALNGGRRRRVFPGSMCDVFDKNAPEGQRERLWSLIRETPMLDWQLLTKRAPNIKRMLPADWGEGYANAWLGVSVGDRKHGVARIAHLRAIPARVRFLSVEPLIEDLGVLDLTGIGWVIVGGESGLHARLLKPEWVLSIKRQCDEQGVPFFFKQWGGRRANANGCLLDGVEIKQWPRAA